MLTVLFLGDVVGEPGRTAVIARMPELKKKYALDFVIVKGKIGVINVQARTFMQPILENPFRAVEAAVMKMRSETANIIVDAHGETTSEKIALGRFLDGRVSAVIGTH